MQGLNQEIYDKVSISDDPTYFKGLVNCCKQAEVGIDNGRMFRSSRLSSSLGPRALPFKKSGASSSSFSCSGGV